jgi:NAD(P) transhydrogenase
MYAEAGATVVSKEEAWKSDLVVKVNPPTSAEATDIGDRMIAGMLAGRQNSELIGQLAKQGATVFDLTMLLRTLSRGQAFDALSSQASIAGYRAVVEVANSMQRPFAGQSTAAGRIDPSRILVVGAGVAGLAAIQAAKNMGAIVTAFDVRAAAAEQVESIGASFLHVEFEEAGDGEGGYAKEMSPEWFAAAEKTLLKECERTNAIITTALIPGRQAPVLIKKNMVEAMPYGGCTVDLAAVAGGNVETTEAGKVVTMPSNGVKCIGYTDLNSRMANTSSAMFSGNISKFLISMSNDDNFEVDLENDEAVRSICSVHKGTPLEPYVPPPPPPKTPEQLAAIQAKEEAAAAAALAAIVDPQAVAQRGAIMASGVAGAATVLGTAVPTAGMASTFALSLWVGSTAVQGVTHALHSPLMSITNAISGMTIIGGMLQLGSGSMPETVPHWLAAGAVSVSAVNLVGGFIITGKMLDMFKRPDDPEEYDHYYFAPPLLLGGGLGLAALSGAASPSLVTTVALASGLGCVGGIACLSNQETARLGVTVGMGGVGVGLAATLATMSLNPAIGAGAYTQLAMFGGVGGLAGYAIARQVGPTQLPQAVAGFHVLVGLAATATAVGDFLVHDASHMDNFHSGSLFMGAWMGSITTTGSIVACGKLAEVFDSKPLQLPARDAINIGLGSASLLSLLGFVATSDPHLGGTCLGAGILASGGLGYHMTSSIGGADMPVVVTLLNSYSGWALCAEGFILDQPVLTIVGALIGSSGAFLTKIMCDGMNRSLTNVILGGFGTEQGVVQTAEGLVHTETSIDGSVDSLLHAERIAIVPGYGMAVAQAAAATAEISNILTDMGKKVEFGVHPVAGRMPGQLNVLLAEAGVPYDNVIEMDEMNEALNAGEYDVAMVIGANDTVNSLAEEDPTCDIGGMPVIRVWESTEVIFMKRSMASGYAGVDNPVFYKDCTNMLLGDAKSSCDGIRNGLASAEK